MIKAHLWFQREAWKPREWKDLIEGHRVLRGGVLTRSLSTAGILHNLAYAGVEPAKIAEPEWGEFPLLVISHPPRLVAKASPMLTYACLSGDCDF